jgi:hypothetical protein
MFFPVAIALNVAILRLLIKRNKDVIISATHNLELYPCHCIDNLL